MTYPGFWDEYEERKDANCPTCEHGEHDSERCTGVIEVRGERRRCDCRTGFVRPAKPEERP